MKWPIIGGQIQLWKRIKDWLSPWIPDNTYHIIYEFFHTNSFIPNSDADPKNRIMTVYIVCMSVSQPPFIFYST